ncbi:MULTISPECIES: Gfo/Idh/MocA family oxidoreductase [Acidobacterium]|uniref:GFO/IDH/MOCA family protein n=1 Tax=Acidobacterium capsulatum (strain ATCC 51196 / DSM 11244 / BCRC 80197 / JCM 7670 / NBRC 15755 / NCIMB 13165 / 161) TaxID=240015 RepID=C1F9H5_ACIC5|nr:MULTISPECIES: Gfo/Idh/MocA family oxidoreductase [Acidobacterium]ACO32327.1 GFO/IDH/MOCA family protein [Acidobacterium capsulatum ATCC 51196]HCT62185.1 gfo/Idh/MocA family oxidoreductase [Acidobacterium sp.]
MTRYGILGFGHHARKRLISAFEGAAHSQLAGFWRHNEQKAAADAAEFGIAAYPTADALCASPEIDAVFITSPDAMHLNDVLLALHHGKPVLCEKPLAMRTPEVEQMLAAAQSAGVFLGVAQNMRYYQSVELIRRWIAEGRIGAPQLVHAQVCHDGTRSPRTWICDPSLACGGPIGDVGIHCIDAVRYVLGDDVSQVATLGHGDAISGQVEAHAALSLAFHSGAVGAVTLTTRGRYRSRLEVTGTTGVIACENALTVDHDVEVQLLRGWDGVEQQERVSNADGYSRMLDAFSAAIQGKEPFRAPATDGLLNQRILDAAYDSMRSGHAVRP